MTLDAAAKLMGYPVSGHAVSRVLQLLEKQPHWTSIRTALLRMSECLTKGHVPVDFSRRRRLSYDSLLPDAAWASICKQTGTPAPTPNRANVVRGYLYESISGQSLNMDPRWPSANQFRTNVANFPQHLTQPLAAALDRHAREFLAGQGIRDEPPTWQPPTDILDGLDLPGADPSSVDVAILHTAIRDGISLGAAAQRANTNLGVARYVLSREPGPEADYEPGTSVARVHSVAYRAAAKALPRERFLELYVDGRMSLQDIAETVGASRQTVARLAADYRIKLRAGREPRTTIDRDWLYEQYVGARRALPDLAADAGVSTATMARWATQYEIPLRPRGGPSHSATLRNAEVHAGAPTLLQPALIGIGGWERLRRFAEVSRFATITEAAEHLGIKQGVLTLQINRVERELNRTLYERAQRGHPMRLTHDGHEVVAAVRSYAQNRCG
ncbi:LysR family transcriptional regulator [Gordonia sputi]